MESSSSNLESILETAVPRSAGVVRNPYLAGGFLMGSSLLGLLIIIWAFWYHRSNLSLFRRSCVLSFTFRESQLMSVQLVHNSLMTLLFFDAVNLIVAVILGAAMVTLSCSYIINCVYVEIAWFLSRWFIVIIHLANASLSIYHLCHQSLTVTRVRSIYFLIGLLIGILIPLFLYATKAATFILAAFMFLFALSVIATSRAPTSSPSTATLKKLIIVVAMCNFLVVYVPTFIVQCLIYTAVYKHDFVNYEFAYANVEVFTNFHLIFDGLLCALILKLPSGEEQQQQWQQQQQQQWQPQQQQQWQPQQQQQWQPQQQQQLGFPNPGYTVSTTVNQY